MSIKKIDIENGKIVNPPKKSHIKKSNYPWYSQVERMLYKYPTLDQAIKNQKDLLRLLELKSMPSFGVARYGDPTPPGTGEKYSDGERFASNEYKNKEREFIQARINLMESQKEFIRAAYSRLTEEEKRLVRLWYFEDWQRKRTDKKIWKELNIGKVTFYKYKNEIIYKIAEWLGKLEQ